MKRSKRMLIELLAASLSVVAVTGCAGGNGAQAPSSSAAPAQSASSPASGASSASAAEAEPPVMEWLMGTISSEVDDNAEVIKMLEERFNVDLKAWQVDSGKFDEALSVRLAGGEMPDVLLARGELSSWVEGGIFHELPIERIREQAPNFVRSCEENDPGNLWTVMSYKGKNYGVACPSSAGPLSLVWRKDWMDKVGVSKAPETLEEMESLLTKFVQEDPDGDGKNDTAGIAERSLSPVFGAYGLRIGTGSNKELGFSPQLGEDNVPFYPHVRPEAKEALALLRRWYEMGLIDKEFISGENHGGYGWLSHSFMNGKIGATCAQSYHYLSYSTDTSDKDNWAVCMKEFKGLEPNGDIVFGKGPIGPTGKSGIEGWSKVGKTVGLTPKCFEDERKVDIFLAMLEAYFSDPEYMSLSNRGIENVHWESVGNSGAWVRLMEGEEIRRQGVLQFDFGDTPAYAATINATKTAFAQSVQGNGYPEFKAPSLPDYDTVGTTMKTMMNQTYFDIITGTKPLEAFDEFVKFFNEHDGAAMEKALQETYAAMLPK